MFDFFKKSEMPTRKKISFFSEEAKKSYELIFAKDVEETNMKKLVLFAENWASLMEEKLASGIKLTKEVIEECERLTSKKCHDKEKSHCVARHLLIVHWKYGELLMTEKDKSFYNGEEHSDKFYARPKKAY